MPSRWDYVMLWLLSKQCNTAACGQTVQREQRRQCMCREETAAERLSGTEGAEGADKADR